MIAKTDLGKIGGTYLIGTIETSFKKLVAVFGQPNGSGDGSKVRAQWALKVINGPVFSIYDWKEDVPVEDVTTWHIGGTESGTPEIASAIEAVGGFNFECR